MRRPGIALALLATGVAPAAAQVPQARFDSAYYAWDAGRYDDALDRLAAILAAAGGEAVLEPIALLTGELYRTREITTDGHTVSWSPDGRWFAYERGTGNERSTVIWDARAPREVGVVQGWGLVFSPDGEGAAFLRGGPGGVAVLAQLDLASMRAEDTATPGLTVLAVRFGVDRGLLLSASDSADILRIYRLLPDGTPYALTADDASRADPRPISPSHVLYVVGRDRVGVLNLGTGDVREYAGTDAAASADGSRVAWVARESEAWVLNVLDVAAGSVTTARRADVPLASPALSADGRRVAFQMMPREDWEIYVADADGTDEERLTHEVQHDLFPRFLPDGRILAVMGEGRHRRSYLYDPVTKRRTRLHHNNTVRTVAPEYEWALSPDGMQLLIGAERDGDTVSPERGVYLMSLDQRVTLDEVRDRIATELAKERALRAEGERSFAPIRADVTNVVSRVSTARIYGYAADLFTFDSKYITRPGNAKAIEYIAAKLREWGYEPELQWFTVRPRIRTAEGFAQGPEVRTANVIAKLPGTVHPELIYVVSSHFDSVDRGPGADDNSSGTSALLEAARVLKDSPQPATLHFAFFTGEEAGLLGSRHYVRTASERGDRIVGALNNDMIGFKNDHRLDNTIRYSNDGIRDIQHAAAFLFTNLITYDAKYYKSTDAAAYYEAYGDIVGGIGSYPILGNPHYHQSHDVLETIDQQLVAEVSKTTVATLMRLAASPARLSGVELTGRRAMWPAAAERDVIEYIVAWGPAAQPLRDQVRVRETSLEFRTTLPPGTVVSVKPVNRRGLEAWDWARAVVR